MYGEVHQAGDPKVYKSRWHFCYRCGAAQAFLGILFGKAALPRKQSLFDTGLGDAFECAAHHLTFAMVPQAKNSVCVQKRSPKKLQKVTFSKPSFRTFFTAVMVALCTAFSADSRVLQKAQKSSEIHRFRNFFGPSVEIRTRGLLNPIQARYQTSPHPDTIFTCCITSA